MHGPSPFAAARGGRGAADPSLRARCPRSAWMNRAVPALIAVALAPLLAPTLARAQFLESGLDRHQFDQSLRQPSLRLVTLGRTGLVFEDENFEINQWDFGRSTVGLLGDRTGHALDLFVDNGDRIAKNTVGQLTKEVERVDGTVFGLSAVARNPDKFAFGIDAGLQNLGTGLPRELGTYQDDKVGLRDIAFTANGRMLNKTLGWGARLAFGKEEYDHRLRNQTLEDGELKLDGGDTFEPLSIFELVEGSGQSTRYGLGLGWMTSPLGDLSINWDHSALTVRGSQNTRRRIYEVEEPRGIDIWSVVATLRPAEWVTFGGTAGFGSYDTEETYRFSLSLGQGAPPAISRGTRYTKDVEGSFLRTRIALEPEALPDLTIGGDFNVRYEKEDATVATGEGSFNDFLDFAERNGFILGPHLENTLDELRHWDGGVGVGYQVTEDVKVGVEGHRANDAFDGTIVHSRRQVTDLRGGVEASLGTEWKGRLGGWRRELDEDVFTENNEGVATALTLGAGWQPTGAKWTLDGGVEILGRSTDYPDPSDGTGSGFRFVLYNRWAFD